MFKKIWYKENIKLWFILFCALNLVFSYNYFTFFWGNHDWDWIKGTIQILSLNTGMFEGRYAKFILNVFLFGGQILPILNNMVAFAFLALGTVFLVNYWQIKDFPSRIVVALIPIVSPYILGWMYFPINILGNFSAVALVSGGLVLSEKRTKITIFFATICFLLALGVYPSVMEMMLICFCVKCILQPDTSWTTILLKFCPLAVSLLLFKCLLLILGKYGYIYQDYYNLKTVSLNELIYRTPQMIILAFNQLVITLPFIELKFKILGCIIIFATILVSFHNLKNSLLWVIAFLTTVLSTWLTGTPEETAYMSRVNFYGLNFFIAGCVACILQQKRIVKNIAFIMALLLIINSININFEAMKVWNFGKKAEEQLINRITVQIEQEKQWQLVPIVAGELSLRPKYYHTSYQKESPYLLNQSLMVRHIPAGMFNFYAVSPLFYGYSQISDLSPELYHFLKTAQKPWPSEKSIYIDNKYAIILLTYEGISAIQAQLPY